MLELVRAQDRHPAAAAAGGGSALGRVVALGGGTGLSAVLRGLCDRGASESLTAVVTVADDGGSSGALRSGCGVQPPGDVRECLLALAGKGTLESLFRYRFNGVADGHSLGNLILTALNEIERDFTGAVRRAGELLQTRGRVLPATPDDVHLLAAFADGTSARGESNIAPRRRRIRRVSLMPGRARATPGVVAAIAEADTIIIGPGSLYTSLLPTLLVRDIATAISRSRANVVFVVNLMTEPGETDGYIASDFLLALRRHAPQLPLDLTLLVNSEPVPEALAARYAEDGAFPVTAECGALRNLGCRVVETALLADDPRVVRHDPARVAEALAWLAVEVAA